MTSQSQATRLAGDHFADVDGGADPESRVRYLDVVTAQARMTKNKQDSYDSLGFQPGAWGLDVGCGTGDDVRALAELVGPTGKVVGLDNSATMIAEACSRSEGSDLPVEFLQASIYGIPFPDDSFDACRAERVFQHLDAPVRALREMKRVTKPGGRISVIDTDWGSMMVDTDNRELMARIDVVARRRRHKQPGDGWRGRQLWTLLNQSGLCDITVEPWVGWTTDLELATQITGVLNWAREAHETGGATAEKAEIWEHELRRRDAAGRFFAATAGFNVVGTVPE